jgi:hypothetical protein
MEFSETPNGTTIRVQGRIVKDFAERASTLIGNSNDVSSLVVDLSNVTFVDAVGERVLSWLKEFGARFTADSAYCLDICERLNLPLAVPRFEDEAGRGGPTRHGRAGMMLMRSGESRCGRFRSMKKAETGWTAITSQWNTR